MLITLSCLFAVSAKEIYVSSDGSDDLNGTDLDNPCSFKRAINISEDGDSIKMKAGNYSISERISKSLNITAYNNDVVNIKHLNSYVFSVVDNKNLVLNSLNFKNFNMAVESSKNPNITINNCLFERSTYMCLNLQGGGTLTITDSIFRNNAGVQGSAINFQNDAYKNRSYVYINNTIFDSNHGSNLGGVIYISLSDMYLYNNTFINNKGDYTGGVIFNDVSRIFDKSSRYVNNGARYSGGAIYIRGDNDLGSYYGDHVEFINNSAPYKNGDPGSYGTSGGVFTAFGGGEIVLNNSVLTGNKAMLRGGAIWSDQRVTIINTLISNNSAYNETGLTIGGGIYCPLLKANIINSTISNNHAKEYPDIFNDITFPSVDIVEVINNTDGKKISIKNLTNPVSYCLQPGILNIANNPIIETGTNKLIGSGGYFRGKPIGELLKIFIVQNYQRVLDGKISKDLFKNVLHFISSGCSLVPSPFNESYSSHRLIKQTLDEYERGIRYPDVNAKGSINWLTKKYLTYNFYQFSNDVHQDLIVFTFNESNITDEPPINVTKKVNITNPDFNTTVSYTITVKNTNRTTLVVDVLVIDTLSEGLIFKGASHNGLYNNTTNTITWILNIPADGEISLFVNATIGKFGKINNTVNVFNKTANVTVNVPNTNVTKTVNVTNPSFNDKVGYTITIFNLNPDVNLINLFVRDVLGEGLVFKGASDGGVYNASSRTITWIINITKGGNAVLHVNATVNKYGKLVNKVFVGNKTANATVYVPKEPPVEPPVDPPVEPPVDPPVNPQVPEKPNVENNKTIKKVSSMNPNNTGNPIFLLVLSVLISIPLIRRSKK